MKRLLTDRFCAGAKARDGEAQTDYFDTQVPGLAFRVSRWDRKSWTLHYSLAGARKRLTFGSYPSLSLAGARTRADEAKAIIATGAIPSFATTETFSDICESYMARDGAKLRLCEMAKECIRASCLPDPWRSPHCRNPKERNRPVARSN